MCNDYIGEIPIKPKLLVNFVRWTMGLELYPNFTIFYYGTPDQHAKELFGLE